VTPLGLGGQASLQWTNRGIDPADIIVRAIELGVNYLDSANAYGPSQANYQTAISELAGLLDFRDGTNYTGLNPEHRHWIRHIGITGHQSSAVLMRALRMDEGNAIDALLVALNVNDRNYCSHQHNAIPVAVAKGMGVIAMKAFADGVFYGTPARFSNNAALSDIASEAERRRIESTVADLHGVETNYFQDKRGLTQPPEPKAIRDADRVSIQWTTGYAGPEPIRSYRIHSGDQVLLSVPFRPQTTTAPLSVTLPAEEAGEGPFRVVASTTAP
jgi:hypothetical protein